MPRQRIFLPTLPSVSKNNLAREFKKAIFYIMRAIFLISLFSAIFSIISNNIFIFLAFETALFVPFLLRHSRVVRKSDTDLADYPFVSIIVPMRNEKIMLLNACVR